MKEVWKKSNREEVISALWFIVAFTGKPYVNPIIFLGFIGLAIITLTSSVIHGFLDRRRK